MKAPAWSAWLRSPGPGGRFLPMPGPAPSIKAFGGPAPPGCQIRELEPAQVGHLEVSVPAGCPPRSGGPRPLGPAWLTAVTSTARGRPQREPCLQGTRVLLMAVCAGMRAHACADVHASARPLALRPWSQDRGERGPGPQKCTPRPAGHGAHTGHQESRAHLPGTARGRVRTLPHSGTAVVRLAQRLALVPKQARDRRSALSPALSNTAFPLLLYLPG